MRLGFFEGGETQVIVVCPQMLKDVPWNLGDVLVHELAHACGWKHEYRNIGVPDWPRNRYGEVDVERAVILYPELESKIRESFGSPKP